MDLSDISRRTALVEQQLQQQQQQQKLQKPSHKTLSSLSPTHSRNLNENLPTTTSTGIENCSRPMSFTFASKGKPETLHGKRMRSGTVTGHSSDYSKQTQPQKKIFFPSLDMMNGRPQQPIPSLGFSNRDAATEGTSTSGTGSHLGLHLLAAGHRQVFNSRPQVVQTSEPHSEEDPSSNEVKREFSCTFAHLNNHLLYRRIYPTNR